MAYCPYCAILCAVAPAKEAAVELPTVAQVTEDTVVTPRPESISVQQPPLVQAETPLESPPEGSRKIAPEVKAPEQRIEPPKPGGDRKSLPPSKWKWIAVAVVLVVGIVGYLVFHNKSGSSQDSLASKQSSTPTTQALGKKESARIVAQDALRIGTGLSLTISKLPKLDKMLKAAKQLGDISPRYQEQITSAESMVSSARTDRDKSLMAYIGKVVELGRYSPDQVSYAVGVIQSGDVSSREKIVVELLAKHVNSSRNNSKADAKKLLSEFNLRFCDFVD